jgi:hypothetical protein
MHFNFMAWRGENDHTTLTTFVPNVTAQTHFMVGTNMCQCSMLVVKEFFGQELKINGAS